MAPRVQKRPRDARSLPSSTQPISSSKGFSSEERPVNDAPANETPSSGAPDLLKMYQQNFENLRSLVTCKICDRLLYEPFVISCGHTYCYSCLCSWFENNKFKKTCPDCRTVILQPPAPAYLIRQMTQVFTGQPQLLDREETAEQHDHWRQEEAETVRKDRENLDPKTGGLFRGCFKINLHRPIRDEDDGVDRCPFCNWEIEDGVCQSCGNDFDSVSDVMERGLGGFSDMDDSTENYMEEDDDDDIGMPAQEFALEMGAQMGQQWAADSMSESQDDSEIENHNFRDASFSNGSARIQHVRHLMSPRPGGRMQRPLTRHLLALGETASDNNGTATDAHFEDHEIHEDDEDEDSSMDSFINDEVEADSEASGSEGADVRVEGSPALVRRVSRYRPMRRTGHNVVESEPSDGHEDSSDDEMDSNSDEGGPVLNRRRRGR